MIRFSVFYPKTEGATFDHDYYRDKHVPLAVKTWGLDGSKVEIDKGIDGPYVATVHFTFESLEAMGAALGGPGTAEVDGRRRELHHDHIGDADQRDRDLNRYSRGSTTRCAGVSRSVPSGRLPGATTWESWIDGSDSSSGRYRW